MKYKIRLKDKEKAINFAKEFVGSLDDDDPLRSLQELGIRLNFKKIIDRKFEKLTLEQSERGLLKLLNDLIYLDALDSGAPIKGIKAELKKKGFVVEVIK